MRNLLCILILMSFGCNNEARPSVNIKSKDSSANIFSKADNSKYYLTKDSLQIADDGDTITYTKEEFNQLIDEHPEFFSDIPQHPDLLYYSVADSRQFGSELGKDEYFALYGYFLRQKNDDVKYTDVRNRIKGIYTNINLLFNYFQHGGPYFYHQAARISGYAEFTVYQYSKNQEGFGKTYDISRQKELYLQSLRQLIADESNIDFETVRAEKPNRLKSANKIVDKLDSLITSNFYLRKAQAFHYDHYQYY